MSKHKVITKRDGTVVPFDRIKITTALYYVFKEVNGKATRKGVRPLTDKVISVLNSRCAKQVSVEDVQDTVENVLMQEGFHKEAKAYILYRENAKCQREKHYLHAEKLVSDYIESTDWRVKENANANYSFPSLVNHISGSVLASYALYRMYPSHIADAHTNGDLHIHDLGCSVVHYCCGWSLKDLLLRGFTGVAGRASANPAKHFDTALLQIVNFLMTQQTEAAGAQAINSFDTLLAPYVRKDNLTYAQVKQCIQQMVFGLNVAARLGQCPFTNVSLDWSIPYDLYNEPIVHAGEYILEETYSDYQHEMDLINKAFLEVMIAGDADGKIFSFPIPTYNVTKDFNWDSENADLLFEMTAKYGIPYFQNFVNSELDPRDVRSMCCRLSLNVKELKTKTGGLFGAGDSTGSIGVVTLNLARLGYLAKDENDLFNRIDTLMDIAKDSLEIKRDYITMNYKNGLMPYTAQYISGYENHFSTIGVVGGNEMCLNFMGKTLIEQDAINLMKRVLLHMRERILLYQEETGNLYNIEASPAEATSHRLARIDIKKYPDIIQASTDTPYYTNSTQLPVGYTDDIYEYLDLQEGLQCLYTGGSVVHIYIGEEITKEQAKYLVKNVCSKYRVPYISITPTFSICPEHGYIPGEHHTCPKCS
jgi:ribonucleoside-triphosphate reductase